MESLHTQEGEDSGKHGGHWVDDAPLAGLQRGKSLIHEELEFKPRGPGRQDPLPAAAESRGRSQSFPGTTLTAQ